jgi:hypothetical protein
MSCRLTYVKGSNKFLLYIPKSYEINVNKPTEKICSIDPGLKSFLTIYSPSGECYKIFNRDNYKTLHRMSNKHHELKTILDERNNNVVKRNPKTYKKLAKAKRKLKRKMTNKMKEIHYKTANFICSNFDTIYLGKLSTQGITS